ncbi:hypothetical protein MLD38_024837 [Melastoma candidum]|uniref:Uncharacterized protein n=1 Tax=Melastoma candidum TaxID=119954 RepID=A0ACB9NTI6_9MYRT|nr:hypothetical protein MLD38_024837 [Melastoma candidum]
MEGNRSLMAVDPGDMLWKIKGLTRSIIGDLCTGHCPTISVDRFRNYCKKNSNLICGCSPDYCEGKSNLTFGRACQARQINFLLRVLLIIQQLLQEKKHGSKRDIYYMYPSLFSAQSVVDRAINDLCIILDCSRHNLNVVSVGKGLVMGWLRFTEAGSWYDCMNNLNAAHSVPVHVEKVDDILSMAQYILVVEKESVFQRLANDRFCSRNHCIVITGRGYPDVPTRRFLRLLFETLHLPTFCLVDCDPFGFDILTTYRFGSQQMAQEAKLLCNPEIRWLGAFPSDFEKYRLPEESLLPLTENDERKIKAMLGRCYLQREVPGWRSELELMLQRRVKFEIEALSVQSISFLCQEYIPSKIDEVREWDSSSHSQSPFTTYLLSQQAASTHT